MSNFGKKVSEVFMMKTGYIMEINEDGCTSYLHKGDSVVSISIPFESNEQIIQKFVGITVYTSHVNFGKVSLPCLCLSASDKVDIEKFSLIAEDFGGSKNRKAIEASPYEWIDKWRTLLGDSIKEKKVYDVIGELLALKEVLRLDRTAMWMGPKAGTHDIVGKDLDYEVKSTIKKTEYEVSINSSYQLSADKTTYLILVRLEEKPYSITINKLVNELIKLGYDKEEIENSLKKLGYPQGDRDRDESYEILSKHIQGF